MESLSNSSSISVVVLSWGSLLAYPKFFLDNADIWLGKITQNGYWKRGGPVLPIEFSRKCDDGSLMSVIDHVHGIPHETHYVAMYERSETAAEDSLVSEQAAPVPLEEIKKRLRKLFLIASGDKITPEEEKHLCTGCVSQSAKDNHKISHAHDQGMIGYLTASDRGVESHSNSHPDTITVIKNWVAQYQVRHAEKHKTVIVFWCDFAPNFERFTVLKALNFVRHGVAASHPMSTSSSSPLLRNYNRIITASRDLIHSKVRGYVERDYLAQYLSVSPGMVCSMYGASKTSLDCVKQWIYKKTFKGRNDYIEYIEGNIPVVLSAPHGGRLKPSEIPDRPSGVLEGDMNSCELAYEIWEEISNLCSTEDEARFPHLILCHLKRSKIDANRDLFDATNGQEFAEEAWHEYNNFIEIAKRKSLEKFGKAHYFDIHGNTASIKIMLGHAIRKLDMEKQTLQHICSMLPFSSVRSLAETQESVAAKVEFFLGKTSFAQLMHDQGVECTPHLQSQKTVEELLSSSELVTFDWGGDLFYEGGYNTRRHGSIRFNDQCNSTQIETPIEWRKTASKRRFMAQGFAKATVQFFKMYYGIDLTKTKP